MTKNQIAYKLVEARKNAGLTQTGLARILRTSQSAVARAESGYWMPGVEFIDRWAIATKTEIPILFGAPEPKMESASARRALVREVLGPGRFNPWERNPSQVEANLLNSAGLTRDYFERLSSNNERRKSSRDRSR